MTSAANRNGQGGNALNAMAEDELTAGAQRDRRKRIIDATMALADKGGFDAVQMRAVAERADVALGTLYRYFPSKVHLLVASLVRELERIQERLDRAPVRGESPYERLLFVLGRLTRAFQRNPNLSEAVTRALMSADASAATEVDAANRMMEGMFIAVMSEGEPSDEQVAVARVIGDVWLSNLVAWVTRRASATDVSRRLELTVRLLLR
ncbi:cholesterol catabolism transcriptional regulator KstR [Saccharopolyspora rhizosphaerae]|uniref:Cholesterol catabolism transcriptional regulator KstR n=1 Tax=Saccharopolyspora rhizosphaerae TaxID=2492662 RepID=A0A426JWF6_9PSEU|nr:cholesterol catabolism transcriptional regulator KstR [Saccharopolyspora rhizosphaerae]RRO17514.1 cholesterol catabolism transcriptional regulator KstR [Saccharopolyspora rhizosphaerae]